MAILVCEENEFDSTGFAVQSRRRVWKRLQPVDSFGDSFPGHKRRRCDQDHEEFIPAQARTRVG